MLTDVRMEVSRIPDKQLNLQVGQSVKPSCISCYLTLRVMGTHLVPVGRQLAPVYHACEGDGSRKGCRYKTYPL